MTEPARPKWGVVYDQLEAAHAREEKLSADLRNAMDEIAELRVRIRSLYAGYVLVAVVGILIEVCR
jgi:hypothetical protein